MILDFTKTVGFTALGTLSLTACVLYLLDPLMRQRQAWAVPALFALLTWFAVSSLADRVEVYTDRPVLAGLVRGTSFLLPPLALAFIMTLSSAPFRLRARHAIHALPAIGIGASLALLFLDARTGEPAVPIAAAIRAHWLGFLVLSAGYLVVALRVLRRDARTIRDYFSFPDNPAQRRQTYVLLSLIVPWGILLAEMAAALVMDLPLPLKTALGLMRLACLMALCAYALQPRGLMLVEGDNAPEPAVPEPPKYARSNLREPDRRRIADKLRRVIEEDKSYRDPFLTLRKLSAKSGVPEHHISQVLSTAFGRNFFDVINGARIEEAKRLLRETDETVLAISETVGFNSRSTFNAAFRKATGTTPSAYRRR
ncbi:MAG: helix-turn-helix transcriptional regulator [Alphaproteobacteria bacterium]